MISSLSNNNAGNTTKSVVEKKKYEDIEKRIDEMQEEIDATAADVSVNSQAISNLNDRVDAVEDNSTFPELNTDTINPATGNKIDVTSDLDVDGKVEANSIETSALTVNGTNFATVKDNAAQAKAIALDAENRADGAYDLADAVADELADYKADNEQSITTGTLNADSVIADSVAAQTINTNDFETTNAEIDKLYVDTIKATGFLELPTAGQQYYTITVPAKTTASFSGVYTSDNNTDYPFYFTVSDGAVIYKQGSTEIIKDISFDRETGYTKVRVKSSTNLTYISTALDNNPVTIEDGGDAYTDYVFIPQKTGGYLIRGYDDTTTEVYIAGVLRAYAMSVEEEIIERTSVDFLKVNASIELPKDWDAGGTISYSTGEENQYISAQTKAGVTKPTWTSPIHSTIGSLSYSSKLVDEATVASYKGISETRQTQTISITNEASLQQLTAFHWTKNGNYWQPYELTRITIGDQTMWIDPTESNQGIRFIGNQVIADGTWDDVPVEEANAVPVNLVIFDAPTELSFPITNLGDKTTVHGEITATCFKGDVLGNVTGNADTATNAACFDNKTYAEAKADILSGCAADSNKFNGKTYSEACADILSGNAASATNATCFDNKTYAEAKSDILSGCAASADNATCFDGHTYADAKTDILSGCASAADNATCFDGKTYSQAKTDILTGTSAQAHCVDIDSLTTNSYPLVMESTTCELGKSGTCPITFTPSTGVLETNQVSTNCIENSGTTKSQYLCATCDLNVDGNAYITGDLTVQGTITTTHSEEVVTPSENIILRDGATTPIASGCYSGMTITNYDGQNNNLEVGVDNEGTLKIGTSSANMEAVATRTCSNCMESCYATKWDATDKQLETKGVTCTHDLCVNGNATITGTLTADLTGTADNATCFGGKTYAQAKSDILSGNAATATNATCFNGCTYAQAKTDILTGNAATATNATCFGGCTYAQAKTDILSGCAADSAKLGNKDASCYIDNSSTAQTKAGHLRIGNPTGCTSTSDGGNGLIMNSLGTIALYKEGTPYIDFHYDKYCGGYSSRICNSYVSQERRGSLDITVNNGIGCTTCTECANYCFKSDGTFTGASKICASTNVYSAGCPVVTTGTLPTVAPGYNCTGTSNYVVTTMVCCAKAICRNQAATGTCHLALFDCNTACSSAGLSVSSACELLYNPATGALTATTVCDCLGVLQTSKTQVTATNIGLTAGECYPLQTVIDCLLHCYGSKPAVYSFAFANASNPYICEGSMYAYNYRIEKLDSNDPVNVNWQKTQWKVEACTGKSWTVSAYVGSTADSITWKTVENIPTTSSICTSSCNAEYPLVFSTCCATPAAGNLTLYNDSANNLMYNPSTNTLTACCVKATCFDGTINMNCVADATSTNAAANSTTRKTILRNQITNVGYITSAAIGLCRGKSGFGLALLSVSCNDAATAWKDYCFNNTGTISANGLRLRNDGGVNTGVYMKVGTASSNANRNIMFTFAVPGCDDTSTAEVQVSSCCPLTYNPSTGVLTATCFDGTATNSTCFGGCTYAEACADIAGSVETTPFTCINDVNAGAQDILMTSATGPLGIVNASTGTNACPLKYNPATGELTACNFIVCSNNKPLAVVSGSITALGKGATACYGGYTGSTAIGFEALACCASIAIGNNARVTSVDGIAIGSASAASNYALAIGLTACACSNSAIAIGGWACANGSCSLAIGHNALTNGNSSGLAVFKDIRYSGFRETTFCIPDSATESDVYLVLDCMFCINPASGCPGYGHNVWPAYGIDGCSGCFYNKICSGRWGAGQQCCFFSLGSHTFTQGCTATVGCNMFVTVIAPVKKEL